MYVLPHKITENEQYEQTSVQTNATIDFYALIGNRKQAMKEKQ